MDDELEEELEEEEEATAEEEEDCAAVALSSASRLRLRDAAVLAAFVASLTCSMRSVTSFLQKHIKQVLLARFVQVVKHQSKRQKIKEFLFRSF